MHTADRAARLHRRLLGQAVAAARQTCSSASQCTCNCRQCFKRPAYIGDPSKSPRPSHLSLCEYAGVEQLRRSSLAPPMRRSSYNRTSVALLFLLVVSAVTHVVLYSIWISADGACDTASPRDGLSPFSRFRRMRDRNDVRLHGNGSAVVVGHFIESTPVVAPVEVGPPPCLARIAKEGFDVDEEAKLLRRRNSAANCSWMGPDHVFYYPPAREDNPQTRLCMCLFSLVHEFFWIEMGVAYHIRGGTLLGAFRNGGLIFGDTDLDADFYLPPDPDSACGIRRWEAQMYITFMMMHAHTVFKSRICPDVDLRWIFKGPSWMKMSATQPGRGMYCGADIHAFAFRSQAEFEQKSRDICSCKIGSKMGRCPDGDKPEKLFAVHYGPTWWLQILPFKGFVNASDPSKGIRLDTPATRMGTLQVLSGYDLDGNGKISMTETRKLFEQNGMHPDEVAALSNAMVSKRSKEVNFLYQYFQNIVALKDTPAHGTEVEIRP